jgi:hypothetical protein
MQVPAMRKRMDGESEAATETMPELPSGGVGSTIEVGRQKSGEGSREEGGRQVITWRQFSYLCGCAATA